MQMNVTGRLRPWSEQGKINSTAESLKNPDLIVRAFGLIRPGEREVFCSVVSVCRLQGMAGYEARACLTCKSPHTALTLWLLMGGLLWLQRLPRRSPQACQRLSVSLTTGCSGRSCGKRWGNEATLRCPTVWAAEDSREGKSKSGSQSLAFVHGKVMSVDNTRGHVYQKQSQEMVLGIETLVIARAALRER